MPMRAGKLDKRIKVYFPTNTQNDLGETVVTYAEGDARFYWANLEEPFARTFAQELVKAGQTTATTPYAIKIRGRQPIQTDCKIFYKDQWLEIAAVLNVGRSEETQVVAFQTAPVIVNK